MYGIFTDEVLRVNSIHGTKKAITFWGMTAS
jgi:hypothetical protein